MNPLRLSEFFQGMGWRTLVLGLLISFSSGCARRAGWDFNTSQHQVILDNQYVIHDIRKEGSNDYSISHLNQLREASHFPGRFTKFDIETLSDSLIKARIRIEFDDYEDAFKSIEMIQTGDTTFRGRIDWISATLQGDRVVKDPWNLDASESRYFRKHEKIRENLFRVAVRDSASNRRRYIKTRGVFEAFAKTDSLSLAKPFFHDSTHVCPTEYYTLDRIYIRDSTLRLEPNHGARDFNFRLIKAKDMLWVTPKWKKYFVEGIQLNPKYASLVKTKRLR